LNEAGYLTQKAVGNSWDSSPIKRNSDSTREKSSSCSLEHGEDEVAVMMFTAGGQLQLVAWLQRCESRWDPAHAAGFYPRSC
jgi:hypothetical protein